MLRRPPRLLDVDGRRVLCSAACLRIARYPDNKCSSHTMWLNGTERERFQEHMEHRACAQAWEKYHEQAERRLRTTALCDIFPGKVSAKGTTE